jgi:bacteriocin leader peptide (microcyclamide/patellamide family)
MEKNLMDLQNLMPQAAQPINRITTGQVPTELAELTEEILGAKAAMSSEGGFDFGSVLASEARFRHLGGITCSYDGDDAE